MQFFNTLYSQERDSIAAVYVAVQEYEYMEALHHSVDDVTKVMQKMNDQMSIDRSFLLLNENASKDNILLCLEKALAFDIVYIFFSGHGLKSSFLPIDFDGIYNSFTYRCFIDLINNSKARHVFISIDACHAGSIHEDLDLYLSYDCTKSVIVMYASQENQTSLESYDLEQGVYTHFFCRFLESMKLRKTYEQMNNYVLENVSEFTSKRQKPGVWYSHADLESYVVFSEIIPHRKEVVVLKSLCEKPIVGYEFELWWSYILLRIFFPKIKSLSVLCI